MNFVAEAMSDADAILFVTDIFEVDFSSPQVLSRYSHVTPVCAVAYIILVVAEPVAGAPPPPKGRNKSQYYFSSRL